MKILFLLGILLTMLFSVNAQSIPVAISIPDEKLDLSTKAVQKNIQINGLLRVDGYVPILRAKIYFKSSSAGGWNPGVILKLNGKSFSARTSANHSRLLREFDSGDKLHPSFAGAKQIADSIPEEFLK